jgi:hypothetical protein
MRTKASVALGFSTRRPLPNGYDLVDVSYRLVKVKQRKYTGRCGGAVETAPGPERAIKGGRYSLDFAIEVATDKYLDQLPLARQERILRRHGLEVTTQTLWDQLDALARKFQLAEAALFEHALSKSVIGLDQTGWKSLDGKKDKQWQMWCITAPGIVCHRIRADKGAETFKALVGNCVGTIVCDALKTTKLAPAKARASCSPGVGLTRIGSSWKRSPITPRRILRSGGSANSTPLTSALATTSNAGSRYDRVSPLPCSRSARPGPGARPC